MVKITNGVDVFEVTSGAYDSIYCHQGYQKVCEKEKAFVAAAGDMRTQTADEIFIEEIQKKPISQWSKDEVKRYAVARNIDLAGTKSVNEAKDVIKKAMNEG